MTEVLVFVEVFYEEEIKHYSFIGEGSPIQIAITGLRSIGIKPEDAEVAGIGISSLELNLN